MARQNDLKCTLLTIAKEAVRKRGRRLSWLRFAQRRTSQGYAFVLDSDTPWEVWHEIVEKAASLHPEYAYAAIVDIASAVLNQDEDLLEGEETLYR